jgi:hypothetical protein
LEYAEVRDMPAPALAKTYCYYGKVAEQARGFADAPLPPDAPEILRKYNLRDTAAMRREYAEAAACDAQRDKIETAAKARGLRLKCLPAKSGE